MAKKDDDIELDEFEDLDLDDMDFEMDDPFSDSIDGPDKNERKPQGSVTRRVLDTAINDMKGKKIVDHGKGLIMNSLSSEGASALNDMSFAVTDIKDGITESFNPLKKELDGIAESVKKLAGEDSWLGSKLGKLQEFLDVDKPSSQQRSDPLGEFNASIQAMFDNIQTNMAGVQASVENNKHAASTAVGTRELVHIAKYNTELHKLYYQNALKLQFEHLYTAKQTYSLLQDQFGALTKYLDNIVRNTALPDAVKITSKEAIAEAARNQLASSVNNAIFKKGKDVLSNVGKNIKAKMVEKLSGATDMLSTANDGLRDIVSMQDEMPITELVGGMIADTVLKQVYKAGSIFIPKNMRRNMDSTLQMAANDPEAFLKSLQIKTSTNNGFATLFNKGISGVAELFKGDSGIDREKMKITNFGNREAAIFDGTTHRSINVVIPELLSEIHSEIKTIRSHGYGLADPSSDSKLRWDTTSSTMSTRGGIRSKLQTRLSNSITTSLKAVESTVGRIVKYTENDVYADLNKRDKDGNIDIAASNKVLEEVVAELPRVLNLYVQKTKGKVNIYSLSSKEFIELFPTDIQDAASIFFKNLVNKAKYTDNDDDDGGLTHELIEMLGKLNNSYSAPIGYITNLGNQNMDLLTESGLVKADEEGKINFLEQGLFSAVNKVLRQTKGYNTKYTTDEDFSKRFDLSETQKYIYKNNSAASGDLSRWTDSELSLKDKAKLIGSDALQMFGMLYNKGSAAFLKGKNGIKGNTKFNVVNDKGEVETLQGLSNFAGHAMITNSDNVHILDRNNITKEDFLKERLGSAELLGLWDKRVREANGAEDKPFDDHDEEKKFQELLDKEYEAFRKGKKQSITDKLQSTVANIFKNNKSKDSSIVMTGLTNIAGKENAENINKASQAFLELGSVIGKTIFDGIKNSSITNKITQSSSEALDFVDMLATLQGSENEEDLALLKEVTEVTAGKLKDKSTKALTDGITKTQSTINKLHGTFKENGIKSLSAGAYKNIINASKKGFSSSLGKLKDFNNKVKSNLSEDTLKTLESIRNSAGDKLKGLSESQLFLKADFSKLTEHLKIDKIKELHDRTLEYASNPSIDYGEVTYEERLQVARVFAGVEALVKEANCKTPEDVLAMTSTLNTLVANSDFVDIIRKDPEFEKFSDLNYMPTQEEVARFVQKYCNTYDRCLAKFQDKLSGLKDKINTDTLTQADKVNDVYTRAMARALEIKEQSYKQNEYNLSGISKQTRTYTDVTTEEWNEAFKNSGILKSEVKVSKTPTPVHTMDRVDAKHRAVTEIIPSLLYGILSAVSTGGTVEYSKLASRYVGFIKDTAPITGPVDMVSTPITAVRINTDGTPVKTTKTLTAEEALQRLVNESENIIAAKTNGGKNTKSSKNKKKTTGYRPIIIEPNEVVKSKWQKAGVSALFDTNGRVPYTREEKIDGLSEKENEMIQETVKAVNEETIDQSRVEEILQPKKQGVLKKSFSFIKNKIDSFFKDEDPKEAAKEAKQNDEKIAEVMKDTMDSIKDQPEVVNNVAEAIKVINGQDSDVLTEEQKKDIKEASKISDTDVVAAAEKAGVKVTDKDGEILKGPFTVWKAVLIIRRLVFKTLWGAVTLPFKLRKFTAPLDKILFKGAFKMAWGAFKLPFQIAAGLLLPEKMVYKLFGKKKVEAKKTDPNDKKEDKEKTEADEIAEKKRDFLASMRKKTLKIARWLDFAKTKKKAEDIVRTKEGELAKFEQENLLKEHERNEKLLAKVREWDNLEPAAQEAFIAQFKNNWVDAKVADGYPKEKAEEAYLQYIQGMEKTHGYTEVDLAKQLFISQGLKLTSKPKEILEKVKKATETASKVQDIIAGKGEGYDAIKDKSMTELLTGYMRGKNDLNPIIFGALMARRAAKHGLKGLIMAPWKLRNTKPIAAAREKVNNLIFKGAKNIHKVPLLAGHALIAPFLPESYLKALATTPKGKRWATTKAYVKDRWNMGKNKLVNGLKNIKSAFGEKIKKKWKELSIDERAEFINLAKLKFFQKLRDGGSSPEDIQKAWNKIVVDKSEDGETLDDLGRAYYESNPDEQKERLTAFQKFKNGINSIGDFFKRDWKETKDGWTKQASNLKDIGKGTLSLGKKLGNFMGRRISQGKVFTDYEGFVKDIVTLSNGDNNRLMGLIKSTFNPDYEYMESFREKYYSKYSEDRNMTNALLALEEDVKALSKRDRMSSHIKSAGKRFINKSGLGQFASSAMDYGKAQALNVTTRATGFVLDKLVPKKLKNNRKAIEALLRRIKTDNKADKQFILKTYTDIKTMMPDAPESEIIQTLQPLINNIIKEKKEKAAVAGKKFSDKFWDKHESWTDKIKKFLPMIALGIGGLIHWAKNDLGGWMGKVANGISILGNKMTQWVTGTMKWIGDKFQTVKNIGKNVLEYGGKAATWFKNTKVGGWLTSWGSKAWGAVKTAGTAVVKGIEGLGKFGPGIIKAAKGLMSKVSGAAKLIKPWIGKLLGGAMKCAGIVNKVSKFLGKLVPGLGWALLAWDLCHTAYDIIINKMGFWRALIKNFLGWDLLGGEKAVDPETGEEFTPDVSAVPKECDDNAQQNQQIASELKRTSEKEEAKIKNGEASEDEELNLKQETTNIKDYEAKLAKKDSEFDELENQFMDAWALLPIEKRNMKIGLKVFLRTKPDDPMSARMMEILVGQWCKNPHGKDMYDSGCYDLGFGGFYWEPETNYFYRLYKQSAKVGEWKEADVDTRPGQGIYKMGSDAGYAVNVAKLSLPEDTLKWLNAIKQRIMRTVIAMVKNIDENKWQLELAKRYGRNGDKRDQAGNDKMLAANRAYKKDANDITRERQDVTFDNGQFYEKNRQEEKTSEEKVNQQMLKKMENETAGVENNGTTEADKAEMYDPRQGNNKPLTDGVIKNLFSFAGTKIADFKKLYPKFQNQLAAFAVDYKNVTGHKPTITSSVRTFSEQAHLYRTKPKGYAAAPGNSPHNWTLGVDIDSLSDHSLKARRAGVFAKHGLVNNVSKEPWHWEPVWNQGTIVNPFTKKGRMKLRSLFNSDTYLNKGLKTPESVWSVIDKALTGDLQMPKQKDVVDKQFSSDFLTRINAKRANAGMSTVNSLGSGQVNMAGIPDTTTENNVAEETPKASIVKVQEDKIAGDMQIQRRLPENPNTGQIDSVSLDQANELAKAENKTSEVLVASIDANKKATDDQLKVANEQTKILKELADHMKSLDDKTEKRDRLAETRVQNQPKNDPVNNHNTNVADKDNRTDKAVPRKDPPFNVHRKYV